MVYSDVIKNNLHLLLPKKAKYTKRDVDAIAIESFFDSKLNAGNTFSEKQAIFIVKCIAIFHNAECSNFITETKKQLYPIF
jgi:hypothetical protein